MLARWMRFGGVSMLSSRVGGDGHLYLTALFKKHLIILAKRHAKDNGCDILEAVYPLLPLASLAADIEHAGVGDSVSRTTSRRWRD